MLNNSDKEMIARLEKMPIEQARRELASGTFGAVGSPNHRFASSWLAVKEAEERDKQDAFNESISRKALRNSNWANIIAISAIVIAIIAIIVPLLIKK
jgi:type IV secretory pathway component VirB8